MGGLLYAANKGTKKSFAVRKFSASWVFLQRQFENGVFLVTFAVLLVLQVFSELPCHNL